MLREPLAVGSLIFLATILILSLPSFVAGLIVGVWHSLPGIAPSLAGFALTIGVLVLCLLILIFRKKKFPDASIFTKYSGFLSLIPAIFIIEWINNESASETRTLLGAIVTGFLFLVTSSFRDNIPHIIWGFSTGVSIYGVGELLRIAGGGALHLKAGAFGANPIFASQFLGLAIFGVWLLHITKRSTPKFTLFVSSILLVCLLSALSWGPIIALAVAFLYANTTKSSTHRLQDYRVRNRIIVWGPLLVGPVIILSRDAIKSFYYSEDSVARLHIWQEFIDLALTSPLTGVGMEKVHSFYSISSSDKFLSPHNLFLEMWVAYGALSIFILFATLIYLFRKINYLGRASLIFLVICSSVSGSLAVSFNFWIGLTLVVIIGSSSLASTNQNAHSSKSRKVNKQPAK